MLVWPTDFGRSLPIISAINGISYDRFRLVAQSLFINHVLLTLVRIVKNSLLVFEFPSGDEPLCRHPYLWIAKEFTNEIVVSPSSNIVTEYLQKYTVHGLNVDSDKLHDYYLPGWYAEASRWCSSGMKEIGHDFEGLKRLNASFERSESQIPGGLDVTLRMVAFGNSFMHEEIWTLKSLCTHMPRSFIVNLPTKVNYRKKWVLVPDIQRLDEEKEKKGADLLKIVLSKWGNIQRNSIQVRSKLQDGDAGEPIMSRVKVLNSAEMKKKAISMFQDCTWLQRTLSGVEQEGKLSYSRTEFQETYLGVIENIWSRISEYKIPLTIVHGDMRGVNIIRYKKKDEPMDIYFLNYGKTCISHPFIDAVTVSKDLMGKIDSDALGEYFKYWKNYEGKEKMVELLHIVDDLCKIIVHLQRHHKAMHCSEYVDDFEEIQQYSEIAELFGKYGRMLAPF